MEQIDEHHAQDEQREVHLCDSDQNSSNFNEDVAPVLKVTSLKSPETQSYSTDTSLTTEETPDCTPEDKERPIIEEDCERDLLATLYQFQQEGYLCDATLVSSDGSEFLAHAGVLAAVSPPIARQMEDCEFGNYLVETSLSTNEICDLIKYAYTGKQSKPSLIIERGLEYTDTVTGSIQAKVINSLSQFAEQGLYCNTEIHTAEEQIQYGQSYMIAARHEFLVDGIRTGSYVCVKIPPVISPLMSCDVKKGGGWHGTSFPTSYSVTSNVVSPLMGSDVAEESDYNTVSFNTKSTVTSAHGITPLMGDEVFQDGKDSLHETSTVASPHEISPLMGLNVFKESDESSFRVSSTDTSPHVIQPLMSCNISKQRYCRWGSSYKPY